MNTRNLQRLALVVACAALLPGCETMQASNGGMNLGGVMSAFSGGGRSSGVGNGLQDVIQGASAAFKDYTPEEQRRLGRDFASVLLGARPLLRNAAVQQYVNEVGWWVAQQAELPKDAKGHPVHFDWRFGVIDSEAVNAYATPGGYVFVTVGLLRRIDSEAELAGVLGHEITHVVHGHYLAAIKKGGFTQIIGGVVQAKAGNSMISSAVVNAVRNIYSKGLDRDDEFDADRYGLLFASRAGYAPNGLPQVLHMYAKESGRDENFQLLFNTHPAPQDRIQRLEPLLASKFASAGDVTNSARFLAMRRRLQ